MQGLKAEEEAGSSTFPERVTGEPAAWTGCSGRKDRDWRFAPVLCMRAFPSGSHQSAAFMSQACLHAPRVRQRGLLPRHGQTGKDAEGAGARLLLSSALDMVCISRDSERSRPPCVWLMGVLSPDASVENWRVRLAMHPASLQPSLKSYRGCQALMASHALGQHVVTAEPTVTCHCDCSKPLGQSEVSRQEQEALLRQMCGCISELSYVTLESPSRGPWHARDRMSCSPERNVMAGISQSI